MCGCAHGIFNPDPECGCCQRWLAQRQADEKTHELLARLSGVLAPRRYRGIAQMATEDGTGLATVQFPLPPGGVDRVILVERFFEWTNSSGSVQFGLFAYDSLPHNGNLVGQTLDPLYQVDWTNRATDTADEVNPIPLKGGEFLLGQWSGLASGALCKANVQFQVAWQGLD